MAKKIMLIRHAERPDKANGILGVAPNGEKDKESLAVRGWQRAGALVRFFEPWNAQFAHPALATPELLFACKPLRENPSQRPLQTLQPLAQHLRTEINISFAEGEEGLLIDAALAAPGPVLIAWKHNRLPKIGKAFSSRAPDEWAFECYDRVWIFEADAQRYSFLDLPQRLLPGDTG